jgi:aldose 1-epimerase
LSNDHWQVGIVPTTGASVAFGRVRRGDAWIDVLRPTPDADLGSSSKCASFIMLPWANRVRDGVLRFGDQTWQLVTTPDDGTARHGTARQYAWRVLEAGGTYIRLAFDSADQLGVNFPFHFTAMAHYMLEDRDFIWQLTLTNADTRPFPCGFGHHPYFVRDRAHEPEITIPCDRLYQMTRAMPDAPPIPVPPSHDFRTPRALDAQTLDDLYTGRDGETPARVRYPHTGVEIALYADPIFAHWIAFAPNQPDLPPYFALEPQTNANDGFNLHARGIAGSGVIVLPPGQSTMGDVVLRIEGD